ncbi:phage protein NinX family protein [Paraburkholderia sp.]|uniref:phage protein NinX family protein n=1 Tax=Paraburkholderia sp. TaxID=1926495 RepID=UPI002D5BEF94|nr:phage protein NinX family protein [Paraburkholderia sp.]HZZ04575.1 phage protein NinX family protein [Paraburkholderia sp.]
MNVADLTGVALDYWVARSLHDFVREIHFTDSGETVSIRGSDRGRPWDGRFTPSTSWEAAAAVLERAERLEVRERTDRGAAHCIAEFEGGHRTVEGRGDSLRIALLRAFVESRFGDSVVDVLREAQAVTGERVGPIGEDSVEGSFEDVPSPDGQIGDIQSAPR